MGAEMKYGVWDRQLRFVGTLTAPDAETAVAWAKIAGTTAPAVAPNTEGKAQLAAWKALPGLEFGNESNQERGHVYPV